MAPANEEAPRTDLNPWFSIWTQPRLTMRMVLDSDPTRMVLLLAMIGGFANALDRASVQSGGDVMSVPVIFAIAAIGGPIFGLIQLYLGGLLVRWTGGWIGGKGSPEGIRAAIAWPNVPLIWALLLWIPELLLYGDEMFRSVTPRMEENWLPALVFGAAEMTIGVWTIVIFVICLSEVQGFSVWRALGNAVLSVLVILVPVVVVIALGGILVTAA